MRIGIVCESTYENKSRVRDIIHQAKVRYGVDDVEIVSRGGSQGAEKLIKKYVLEFGLKYKEFNAAHTPQNLYSGCVASFYNKPYTPSNFIVRDKIFAEYIDACFCLQDPNSDGKQIQRIVSILKKKNKKYTILN